MFYYIKGILAELWQDRIVVEASGVGYMLSVSPSTASKLASSKGKTVTVYCAMDQKDDLPELYGFISAEELELFKKLVTVSGIGPKGAVSVLGVMSAEQLVSAIASGDHKAIARAPGVGAKTAQKIVLELKDKIRKTYGDVAVVPEAEADVSELSAVIDTLMVYGFKREQIERALAQVDRTLPTEKLLGETLRVLGKN